MKDLLISKRFWLAVLTSVSTFAQIVPPKTAAYLMAAGAIGTKVIDIFNQPPDDPTGNIHTTTGSDPAAGKNPVAGPPAA